MNRAGRPRDHDAVVIGGGPAGLAAGMHLSRAGYRTILLEKDKLGGQARRIERIENYPGFPEGIPGRDLMALWAAHGRRWKLRFLKSQAEKITRQGGRFKVIPASGPPLLSRAVVCCPGGEFKRLGVPGEERLAGRGVHHAAFEEASRFRGKTVAVAGAGEAALHQAILLSRFARRVYLLNRGRGIKAHRLLRERAARLPNLEHVPNSVVEGLEGESRLERAWVRDTAGGRQRRLDISGLFVLVGKEKTSLRPSAGARLPGFFTAGDASGGSCRQVVVAAGKGVEAAMQCIRHLEGWS